jgi:hypothetical protein
MTTDAEIINALRALIHKMGAEASIQAWINSIHDTMPADDCVDAINTIAKEYDKKQALFQIAVLMEEYSISNEDISNEITRLKSTGWPYNR